MSSMMKQVEVLRAACCVAGLDQNVDENERAVLERLAGRIGVGKPSLDAMIDRAERDRSFFEQQFRVLKADADSAMEVMFEVALADGRLDLEQRVVLHHFATLLGMSDERYDRLLADAEKRLGGG